MLPLILSLVLASLSGFWVLKLIPDKKILLFHLILTFISPWFLILFFGQFPFNIPSEKILKCNQNSWGRACLSSGEFLFFLGDPRENLHIEDQGFFLLSTLPLILSGLYISVSKNETKYKLTILVLLIGFIISFFVGKNPNLASSLWFLPILGIFGTIGTYHWFNYLFNKTKWYVIKLLIALNLIWLSFEILRLYFLIFLHKPFGN